MTESQSGATGPLRLPREDEDSGNLELLAIEEQFAEALRSGAGPRLADYLRRYPQYVEQLTEFASLYLPEARRDAEDAPGAHHELAEAVEAAEAAEPGLSAGTRRALSTILAGLNTSAGTEEPLRVAEQQAKYTTQPAERDASAWIAGMPLPELAERAGISPEELAEVTRVAADTTEMLSPVFVRRIAAALGISEDDARRALAAGS